MKKLLAVLAAGFMMTGCMTVSENDKVFAISARKILIGKSMNDATAKIPAGATVLHVMHQEGPLGLGLISMTYIAGTK